MTSQAAEKSAAVAISLRRRFCYISNFRAKSYTGCIFYGCKGTKTGVL